MSTNNDETWKPEIQLSNSITGHLILGAFKFLFELLVIGLIHWLFPHLLGAKVYPFSLLACILLAVVVACAVAHATITYRYSIYVERPFPQGTILSSLIVVSTIIITCVIAYFLLHSYIITITLAAIVVLVDLAQEVYTAGPEVTADEHHEKQRELAELTARTFKDEISLLNDSCPKNSHPQGLLDNPHHGNEDEDEIEKSNSTNSNTDTDKYPFKFRDPLITYLLIDSLKYVFELLILALIYWLLPQILESSKYSFHLCAGVLLIIIITSSIAHSTIQYIGIQYTKKHFTSGKYRSILRIVSTLCISLAASIYFFGISKTSITLVALVTAIDFLWEVCLGGMLDKERKAHYRVK